MNRIYLSLIYLWALTFVSGRDNVLLAQDVPSAPSALSASSVPNACTPAPIPLAVVINHIDGDTILISTKSCLFVTRYYCIQGIIPLRLRGINTPELHGKCEQEKQKAQEALAELQRLVPKGTTIQLFKVGLEKYGRVLAEISTQDGINIGKQMLNAELAHPYFGGHRDPLEWCSDSANLRSPTELQKESPSYATS